MATVLEHCRVAPPPGAVAQKSLPLTSFDLGWIHFPPVPVILFYELPKSTPFSMNSTIIPKMKDSLSSTLTHFFPLAGNLIFPLNSGKPELLYIDGDSVSLTFAESNNDFNYLTGNHARKADEFEHLIPRLPPLTTASDSIIVPLLAIQVTLFPGCGISVGLVCRHVAGDANTMCNFMRTWASITKSGKDAPLPAGVSFPLYDRSMIKDPKDKELYTIYWNQMVETKPEEPKPRDISTTKVRATFVMARADIQQLKKLVSARRPTLTHLSSFTVVSAYVWSCMAKLLAKDGEEIAANISEHFLIHVDCRTRLDPPLPPAYFGNCIVLWLATVKTAQLIQEDGFFNAAEAIGQTIGKRLHSEGGALEGAETVMAELKEKRCLAVSGSPKFDFYGTDFGWGKPRKYEMLLVDESNSISLVPDREGKGDLEIGVCFSGIKMHTFATIFTNGLKDLFMMI